ncbi:MULTISPECIES: hypothetical protein [Staphylococcus]|uniref:Uncharacterized protein n=2 Tax=Staphylococcus cohnii TaxID=29382 RepID=A0ABT6J296_9STAP|nr:hypothetical protein [Staphylococcus cohnii]MDE1710529.1 hypothetical protein [Staphylococcus cohnii]MDH5140805.1 hypothetical protein [Staphylococcus cohnii]MDH5158882.1 hypothetical protein [Staphylococcus cohnii]MDH5170426.1 hypothetical protein [Staphylococcus cohnii]GEP87990.1 hypothetical protein SCO01_21800 [Staphylococcus cohnii subsp. cohnii]
MPSIEKTVLNDDSCVYYDYLEDIIKEIMNMDTSSLKKNLLADFTYQSLCRWRSESKILELKLDSFMNKVLDSNYYEGSKLFRMLSHSIEETIHDFDEDKKHFNYFKSYILTEGKEENWEQITDNITAFNSKVLNDIQNEYNKVLNDTKNECDEVESNTIKKNKKLNFNYLYYCFEVSNNIVKAKDNKSKKYNLFFVDKYKIEMPFLDRLLIKYLNQEIGQQSIDYNMQTMFEKENYDRSSTIEKLMAVKNFKYENKDLDLFKKLFNNLENSIDKLGVYLLNNGINSNDENARYYRSFLKELSEMKNKLKLFSIEIGNSSGGKQHYPHSDKKERRKNKEEAYHNSDNKKDIDSKLKSNINDYINNLLSLKIRRQLYDSSPNVKK